MKAMVLKKVEEEKREALKKKVVTTPLKH